MRDAGTGAVSAAGGRLAVVVLLAITVAWGATFVVVQQASARIGVLDFLALRFTVAAAAMALLRPSSLRRLSPAGRWHGVLLGTVLGVGYVGQTFGLMHTSAAVS